MTASREMIALWFLPNSCRPRDVEHNPTPAATRRDRSVAEQEMLSGTEGSLVSPAGGSEVVGSATAAHDSEGVGVGVGEPIVVSGPQVSG